MSEKDILETEDETNRRIEEAGYDIGPNWERNN